MLQDPQNNDLSLASKKSLGMEENFSLTLLFTKLRVHKSLL